MTKTPCTCTYLVNETSNILITYLKAYCAPNIDMSIYIGGAFDLSS